MEGSAKVELKSRTMLPRRPLLCWRCICPMGEKVQPLLSGVEMSCNDDLNRQMNNRKSSIRGMPLYQASCDPPQKKRALKYLMKEDSCTAEATEAAVYSQPVCLCMTTYVRKMSHQTTAVN